MFYKFTFSSVVLFFSQVLPLAGTLLGPVIIIIIIIIIIIPIIIVGSV